MNDALKNPRVVISKTYDIFPSEKMRVTSAIMEMYDKEYSQAAYAASILASPMLMLEQKMNQSDEAAQKMKQSQPQAIVQAEEEDEKPDTLHSLNKWWARVIETEGSEGPCYIKNQLKTDLQRQLFDLPKQYLNSETESNLFFFGEVYDKIKRFGENGEVIGRTYDSASMCKAYV